MRKLNMELTEEDEKRIEELKTILGLTKNTEVVRFCINKMYKQEKLFLKTKDILKDYSAEN